MKIKITEIEDDQMLDTELEALGLSREEFDSSLEKLRQGSEEGQGLVMWLNTRKH